MIYKVIKSFTDLQDNNHVYVEGDVFPREGVEVDNARFLELSTAANKRKEVLIVVEDDDPEDNAPDAGETAENQPENGDNEAADESVAEPEKAPKKRKKEK